VDDSKLESLLIKAGLEELLKREPDEEEGKEKKESRKKNNE
jgi:hypothetical protein